VEAPRWTENRDGGRDWSGQSDSDSVDTAVSIYSKIYPVGSVCGSRECSIQRCDPHSSQITSATDLRFY